MYGVSPAFILSGWGESFTPDEYTAALEVIARLGFQGFQLEVFAEERLGEWLGAGAARTAARARELGLRPTQFVAHFLLDCLATPENIRSDRGLEGLRGVLGVLDRYPDCPLVTLPVGPFRADRPDTGLSRPGAYDSLLMHFTEKLERLLGLVTASGRSLALEILPYSLLAGTEGFLRVAGAIGSDRLGLNFDTGHAWVCKEELSLIPLKLGRRIFGTHLCDNHGHENLSLRPGAGSIPWPAVLGHLLAGGYGGSLDIEIRCPADDLEAEYRSALSYIQSVLPEQAYQEDHP